MMVTLEPCDNQFELDIEHTADGKVELTFCAVTFSMSPAEFAELTDALVRAQWTPTTSEVPL